MIHLGLGLEFRILSQSQAHSSQPVCSVSVAFRGIVAYNIFWNWHNFFLKDFIHLFDRQSSQVGREAGREREVEEC